MLFGQLIIAGLGLLDDSIKESGVLLTTVSSGIDLVWKTSIKVGAPTETPFDLWIIYDSESGAISHQGVDEKDRLEFLCVTPVLLGQHLERQDGRNYQISEFEVVPGKSKEMYIVKAHLVTTGERT